MDAPRRKAPDQDQRDAAIAERARNVVIDAGAGTGKTTILVERVVRMVAPPDGSADTPIPIGRIAGVTFTRRAAGELRLRIRERLLGELASPSTGDARRSLLREALAGLDTAYVGTIHSFADRLLRLRPVEARLSPAYEVVEDNGELVRETFDVLLHAARSGTLAGELRGTDAEGLASEAERTVVDALRAGLRRDSEELEYYTKFGLDALVRELIDHRDVPPVLREVRELDRDAFVAAVDEFLALVAPVVGNSIGARWLCGTARLLSGLRAESDPVAILAATRGRLKGPHDDSMGVGFGNDKVARRAWKLFDVGRLRNEQRERPLRDDILDPLRAWLAPRLVRLFPVVVALYETVKQRHRAVDQIDLLLELRKLLCDDPGSRAYYQSLFDHVLVDEFQDTDPLQAEVVVFLCEDGARAEIWHEARLAPGKLTIVGDPKQSIYRFRRADIGMYDEVRRLVTGQEHLAARLSANFRSLEPLIGFYNDRFRRILGDPPDASQHFDPEKGEVFHQDLDAGRTDGAAGACVEILPFGFVPDGKENVAAHRELEGEMLAAYLRRLVASGERRIEDPVTGETRGLRYGDVAVLALTTTNLHQLFKSLDRMSVPYAARGGRLFLQDDLQRRFILGLRAIANRDDGPALAALLRPPFFAVDPLDLVLERALRPSGGDALADDGPAAATDERTARAREARDLIRELRRGRFDRPPGDTARALLEQSALARTVALEPNGEQRLHHLREICHILESLAAREGRDFDGATAKLRQWIDAPAQLDPPHPVGGDAVHVLTVHQAKGLEFPVVVLWDGCAPLSDRNNQLPAWRSARDGAAWAIALRDLAWEEPRGAALKETEKDYRDAERKRLVYVAATRARDLLVLPRPLAMKNGYVSFHLTDSPPAGSAVQLEPFLKGAGAPWSEGIEAPDAVSLEDFTTLDREVAARWAESAQDAARPRFQPVGVTGLPVDEASSAPAVAVPSGELAAQVAGRGNLAAQVVGRGDLAVADDGRGQIAAADAGGGDLAADDELALPRKERKGRYGALFGETVHLAIARAVRAPARDAADVVREAAALTGLVEHLDEAAADVARAIAALRAASLLDGGVTWRFEYPLAGRRDGQLVLGYVDFLAVGPGGVHVVDFKTDAPPEGPEQVRVEYARQVEAYAGLLREAGLADGAPVRTGLLFTAAESIFWLGKEERS